MLLLLVISGFSLLLLFSPGSTSLIYIERNRSLVARELLYILIQAFKHDLTLHVPSKSPLVNCNSSWAFGADNIAKLRPTSSIREPSQPFNSFFFRLTTRLLLVHRNTVSQNVVLQQACYNVASTGMSRRFCVKRSETNTRNFSRGKHDTSEGRI